MVITPDTQPYIQLLQPRWHHGKVQEVAMLRLDVLDPVISGNKWYKLGYNIEYCIANRIGTILTFGGGFSNHLVATAAMAKQYGLQSIGIVRGHYNNELTPTLKDCVACGMQLNFVTQEDYAKKTDEAWLEALAIKYDHPFIIPEGGANEQGRLGAGLIAEYIPDDYTHVCVSAGTGTTLVGIINHTLQEVSGYAPMKGGGYLYQEVLPFVDPGRREAYSVYGDWHFGGFGKCTDELIAFMNEFYQQNNIPLDMVYTAKMMYGLRQQIFASEFPADARILCIHTGGLQGNTTIEDRLLY